ncbi:MAG: hypothetical protein Q7U04_15900 [Bacteriovorax sp.]|nr:hypothetical protein [Bacteriovorax sp.]
MIKLFSCLIIFNFFQAVFSQEKIQNSTFQIESSKEIPIELNILITSIQIALGSEKILPIVLNIDSYARVLTKEDIFLIGKVEIYKTILKTNENSKKAIIDGNSLKILKESLHKVNEPFLKWFLSALLADCNTLLNSPKFKEYLLQKNAGHLENLEFKKIDKKVQLLFRWISKLNPDTQDFEEVIKQELIPSMMDSLQNIEKSFYLMATSTSFAPFPGLITSTDELKFFSVIKIAPAKELKQKEKSIEDILAPVTEEVKPPEAILVEPSKEDWLNLDNSPSNLKNLPKPSDDTNWLQDF